MPLVIEGHPHRSLADLGRKLARRLSSWLHLLRRWSLRQTRGGSVWPNGSVRAAVERHEIGSGAIYTWRRQAMSGALSRVPARPQTAFAEVRVIEPPVMLSAPPVEVPADARATGQIGIGLTSGVRLRVDGR